MLTTMTLWIALSGCVEDVGKDKVKAVVEDVEPATAEAPAAEPVGDAWTVDVEQSRLHALGAKITATHDIVFPAFEGEITVAEGQVVDLAFTADMAKLEADHPKLTTHLKNEDFFDVPSHPSATFDATKIAKGAAVEGMTHTVTGELTIRGTTKQVTFPAKIDVKGDTVTAHSQFTVDRQDFKVSYPGKPDDLVQDNVVLTVDFVAERPSS